MNPQPAIPQPQTQTARNNQQSKKNGVHSSPPPLPPPTPDLPIKKTLLFLCQYHRPVASSAPTNGPDLTPPTHPTTTNRPIHFHVLQPNCGHRPPHLRRGVLPPFLQRSPLRALRLRPVPHSGRRLRAHLTSPQPVPLCAVRELRCLLRTLSRGGAKP
ncbi:unnamed protein product [Camellia sinensis]